MMVSEDLGVAREDRAFVRRIQVGFNPHRTLLLKGGEQSEQQGQQVAVKLGGPARPLECAFEPGPGQLHRAQRVTEQKGTDRGSEDSHQLVRQRFENDPYLATRQDETAEHADEDDNKADGIDHGLFIGSSEGWAGRPKQHIALSPRDGWMADLPSMMGD